MPRVASRGRIPSPAGSLHADFYRQEFLKHRECLARQREYFSERAITDAEKALARVLGQLDQICAKEDAEQLISRLLRKFDAVTGLSGWSDSSQLH